MAGREFAIIEAPSGLGLKAHGVEDAPQALLDAGLARLLAARHAGRVVPPPREARRAESGIRNEAAIAEYSADLADAVASTLDAGGFPLVLGGDCSILLGNLLALRRRGRYGLLFLDGHADFYQPEADPDGEVASMELALAVGRGPAPLAYLEGHDALVREEDVVALGRRDREEAEECGSQRIADSAITVLDLEAIRALGADQAAARALEHLDSRPIEGFWIHLDVDILDDALMPAVDYRLPGGLSWTELDAILGAVVGSERAVGLDVAIYNPRLDPDGTVGRGLVGQLGAALTA